MEISTTEIERIIGKFADTAIVVLQQFTEDFQGSKGILSELAWLNQRLDD